MKKTKNSNTNTKILDKSKKWWDEYEDIYTFKMVPINEVYLDRLFQELIEWAEADDDALKISEFFLRKRIAWDSITRFRARAPKYERAYQHALVIIGNRREKGGLKRKYDSGMVSYTMAHYDPSWGKLAEEKAKLRLLADQQQDAGPKIVVIERFPEATEGKKETIDIPKITHELD